MPAIRCIAHGARYAGIAALAALLGCTTTPILPPNITLDARGVVAFMGQPAAPEQLPQKLRKAGYTTKQEIRVHLIDAAHNLPAMGKVIDALHKAGYARVLFMEEARASSQAAGEPEVVAPPTAAP